MKLADRFRVLHALDGLAREHVGLSIGGGGLVLVSPHSRVSAYAKSLCREISEAYDEHPVEVGELIGARQAIHNIPHRPTKTETSRVMVEKTQAK